MANSGYKVFNPDNLQGVSVNRRIVDLPDTVRNAVRTEIRKVLPAGWTEQELEQTARNLMQGATIAGLENTDVDIAPIMDEWAKLVSFDPNDVAVPQAAWLIQDELGKQAVFAVSLQPDSTMVNGAVWIPEMFVFNDRYRVWERSQTPMRPFISLQRYESAEQMHDEFDFPVELTGDAVQYRISLEMLSAENLGVGAFGRDILSGREATPQEIQAFAHMQQTLRNKDIQAHECKNTIPIQKPEEERGLPHERQTKYQKDSREKIESWVKQQIFSIHGDAEDMWIFEKALDRMTSVALRDAGVKSIASQTIGENKAEKLYPSPAAFQKLLNSSKEPASYVFNNGKTKILLYADSANAWSWDAITEHGEYQGTSFGPVDKAYFKMCEEIPNLCSQSDLDAFPEQLVYSMLASGSFERVAREDRFATMRRTEFVANLPATLQNEIKGRLTEALSEEYKIPEALETAIDGGMNSRLCDLSDTIGEAAIDDIMNKWREQRKSVPEGMLIYPNVNEFKQCFGEQWFVAGTHDGPYLCEITQKDDNHWIFYGSFSDNQPFTCYGNSFEDAYKLGFANTQLAIGGNYPNGVGIANPNRPNMPYMSPDWMKAMQGFIKPPEKKIPPKQTDKAKIVGPTIEKNIKRER